MAILWSFYVETRGLSRQIERYASTKHDAKPLIYEQKRHAWLKRSTVNNPHKKKRPHALPWPAILRKSKQVLKSTFETGEMLDGERLKPASEDGAAWRRWSL